MKHPEIANAVASRRLEDRLAAHAPIPVERPPQIRLDRVPHQLQVAASPARAERVHVRPCPLAIGRLVHAHVASEVPELTRKDRKHAKSAPLGVMDRRRWIRRRVFARSAPTRLDITDPLAGTIDVRLTSGHTPADLGRTQERVGTVVVGDAAVIDSATDISRRVGRLRCRCVGRLRYHGIGCVGRRRVGRIWRRRCIDHALLGALTTHERTGDEGRRHQSIPPTRSP